MRETLVLISAQSQVHHIVDSSHGATDNPLTGRSSGKVGYMADFRTIRETVERTVGEVLDARIGEMRREIVSRVTNELEPALAIAPGGAPTDLLKAAVNSVQDATSQADILRAMLDGATSFSKRCGLLVLRGTSATGWQARGFGDHGFANNDAFRAFVVDANSGLISRVLNSKLPAGAAADEFDSGFVTKFGAPADGNVLLLPLVIKDKVAALLYADGGDEKALDGSALELLVRSTGHWVELLALRKSTPAEVSQTTAATSPAAAVPPAVSHPAPTAVDRVQPASYAVAQPAAVALPVAVAPPAPAASAVTTPASDANEDPVHTKARRFAKLLVDEIKLYNQAKVSEGRSNRDLYDRLKDDIDKSRSAYEKRYGGVVGDVNYFRQELVRILADNDVTLLGRNFPQ